MKGLAEGKALESMDKDELLETAESLGIEGLNRRYSEDTIRERIQEVL